MSGRPIKRTLRDEQAHVPKTCGQQKPAAAEEPGDKRQKA